MLGEKWESDWKWVQGPLPSGGALFLDLHAGYRSVHFVETCGSYSYALFTFLYFGFNLVTSLLAMSL